MPLINGSDRRGRYWRYGNGKRYYYTPYDLQSSHKAKLLAIKQAVAIAYSKARKR